MTHYEPLVKELSESAIMGQRFTGLIRRWEINNEPPPRIEPPYVHNPSVFEQSPNAKFRRAQPQPRKWGQARLADAEDEYFNGGASDEETPSNTSPTAGRTRSGRGVPSVRRASGGKRPVRPTNVAIPKTFPIGGLAALVDYQEEEEQSPVHQDSPRPKRLKRDIGGKSELTRTVSSMNLAELSGGTSVEESSAGRSKELMPVMMEEDEDLIGPPVPLSHKRRREEDEDEEALERLAKRPALGAENQKTRGAKARGVSPAPSSASEEGDGNVGGSGSAATGGSGKLRLKVKLGAKPSGPTQDSPPPDKAVKVGDKG